MAGRAHRGHVVCVDARPRIGVRTNVMGGVTGGADGRDGEALAEQTLTVNTHRVMLENVLLRYLVSSGYGRSLAVTGSTEHRHVHHRRRRLVVRGRQDIVLAVTVGTDRAPSDRRASAAAPCRLPFVRIGLGPVAAAAIDRLQVLGVPPALAAGQILVAIHAGHVGMNGCRVGRFVDVSRYLFVSMESGEFGVVMASEAPLVVLGRAGVAANQRIAAATTSQPLPRLLCGTRGSGERPRERGASCTAFAISYLPDANGL